MSFKYIFIGLPGAGKTTALKALIKDSYPDMPVLFMDDEVKKRLNSTLALDTPRLSLSDFSLEDKLINEICRDWCKRFKKEDVLDALMRKGYPKHSAATMKILGEPAWRELEASIAADFISSRSDAAFDLGAKQPLHPIVKDACETLGFKFIYFDADVDTICQHLSTKQDDGRQRWQQISNYNAAGEDGWKELAMEHRKQRETLYRDIANITINVSNMSIQEVIESIKTIISIDEESCLDNNDVVKGVSEQHFEILSFSGNATINSGQKKLTTSDVDEPKFVAEKIKLEY